MFKQKFATAAALLGLLFVGFQINGLAFVPRKKKQAAFTVRIENIADKDGLNGHRRLEIPIRTLARTLCRFQRQAGSVQGRQESGTCN